MLRWAETPDQVFQAVVNEWLAFMIKEIYPFTDHYTPNEEELKKCDEKYALYLPSSARLFTRQEWTVIVASLRRASAEDGRLFQLTDYHWLMLYESLKVFCDLQGDTSRETGQPVQCGPYRIGRLECDDIVEYYFWDLDFLEAPYTVTICPGINPETWGLAHGLKPHPEELVIRVVLDGDEPRHPVRWSGDKEVPVYPPESWPDDPDRPRMGGLK